MRRREFLRTTVAATGSAWATLSASATIASSSANDQVTVCVMGVRGRGGSLLRTFASLPDVIVKYVCDLDPQVLGRSLEQLRDTPSRHARGMVDYRAALDDPAVDALVIGTPDHWHALPTIHACQAGKDVYVEKPDGHNLLEGRTMVAAARKYERIVQLGTQARSGQLQQSAMEYLAEGHLGKVRMAKAWESSRQGAIGRPDDTAAPAGVDYDRWLGPAPLRPFNPRRFHGSWRWFFDYGTGDLGNDGVHRLDVARWALTTARAAQGEATPDMPRAVSAHGGKLYFDDAQEWPDTLMVSYDYPECLLTYEMRIWTAYPLHDEAEGAAVYGDAGSLVIGNGRWRAFDERGRLVKEITGGANDLPHARNFIDCLRSRRKPHADLETVGHPSSVLCHLGNAAWRAGRSLRFDQQTYRFVDDDAANQLVTRPIYRAPFLLPAIDAL
ncbi:MAG: Gfo/Idh/MocA family oxidoreductase [Pirellulaceae bacterium]|nr:Gfo/Idh/MocA family oxidoreductase [Pirellulaceae bacterium]